MNKNQLKKNFWRHLIVLITFLTSSIIPFPGGTVWAEGMTPPDPQQVPGAVNNSSSPSVPAAGSTPAPPASVTSASVTNEALATSITPLNSLTPATNTNAAPASASNENQTPENTQQTPWQEQRFFYPLNLSADRPNQPPKDIPVRANKRTVSVNENDTLPMWDTADPQDAAGQSAGTSDSILGHLLTRWSDGLLANPALKRTMDKLFEFPLGPSQQGEQNQEPSAQVQLTDNNTKAQQAVIALLNQRGRQVPTPVVGAASSNGQDSSTNDSSPQQS